MIYLVELVGVGKAKKRRWNWQVVDLEIWR